MREILCESTFFGVAVSILAYELGIFLKKKLKLAIFNPLLVAVAAVIVFLLITGVDFESYQAGADKLSYLLTPATVCLAIPLYEQIAASEKPCQGYYGGTGFRRSHKPDFYIGNGGGFRLSHEEYVTLLPKSITTAIGMGVSEELGGIVTITVAVILVTGILGNVIAEPVCRLFKIQEPVAKGVAIGSAAHAIGTAKAMEMGEIEGAMSSLSIAVAGLLTVAGASVFASFL